MTKRRRRVRIIALVAIAILVGFVHVGGSGPLEAWLGWTTASNILFGVTAVLMLGAAWNLLGFFIDKDDSNSGPPGGRDIPPRNN